MRLVDRLRIEGAVLSYDWWLELRETPGRRRRDLRRELRANLLDSAAQHGARRAVQALGRTRDMAAEAVAGSRKRPRWITGAAVAMMAMGMTLFVGFFSALAWADGVIAADSTRDVAGVMTLFPGSWLEYSPQPTGLVMAFSPGWLPLAVGLLAFAVAARPWRSLNDRTNHSPQSHSTSH